MKPIQTSYQIISDHNQGKPEEIIQQSESLVTGYVPLSEYITLLEIDGKYKTFFSKDQIMFFEM